MLATALVTCLRYSPFEVDLTDEMRDQTAKNLAKLAALPRDPVSPQQPLRFAFIADTHGHHAKWNRVVDYLNARSDIELVVHTGDLTDHGMAQEYEWAWEVFSRLRMPFFAAPGNHDGLANGPVLWGMMFGPENFVVDYAGVRFLFFNSNPNEWHHADPDFEWLRGELAAAGSAPKWIVTHQPPSSVPHLSEVQTLQLWRTLRRGGVDAYLYGHLHDDFAAREVEGITFAKARGADDGAFYVVTTDGIDVQLEACIVDSCVPARPVLAPGTDPPPPEIIR